MSTTSGSRLSTLGRAIYRQLLKVFGPAQLGRADEPPPDPTRPVPDPACSQCGRPTSEHTIVRDGGRSHMRCPAA